MAQPTRRGIVSAGTWTVDRIKIIDSWPDEEHLAEIVATDQQGGGSGHNLAVNIRRLDSSIPVEAIGLIGNDADGDYLTSQAKSVGIDTSQLHRTDEADTSFTDVMSDGRTGRRTFFHHRGSSDLLTPNHFDLNKCHGKILHLGLLGLHAALDGEWLNGRNGWVAILQAAQTCGMKTNLELVSIAAENIHKVASPCLPFLDSLIINEYELSALARMDVTDDDGNPLSDRCTEAARRVLSQGTMSLVVAHFPQAAIAVTSDGQVLHKKSFTVDKTHIASAVGAGDAFAAGMLYGLHDHWDLPATLELAHAVAAASLRATTTVGAVESVESCLQFAKNAG